MCERRGIVVEYYLVVFRYVVEGGVLIRGMLLLGCLFCGVIIFFKVRVLFGEFSF